MATKRARITSNTFVPGEERGQMIPKFEGTVEDFDEEIAAQLVAAGRAVLVDDKTELVDTTPADDKPKRGKAGAEA
ncbi:MAG: hypothetical protein NBV67_00365 [Tagaea sp.]|nr:hypothetical protein [Tagaea sp.]